MFESKSTVDRRRFLTAGAAVMAGTAVVDPAGATAAADPAPIVRPPEGKRILLACKLSMIKAERNGQKLDLADRLSLAGEAGFDGVDLDEAAACSPEQARQAVARSGVFVHNAINHAHWSQRLTSVNPEERARGRANIEHCLRVAHGAGGSGVLIVVGRGDDGPADEIDGRCQQEIKALIPLAAALGQPILVENVWNRMHYDHDAPPEQTAERYVKFIDSFNSPWVGMYYDIGNHWKYGQPGDWIRTLGHRCVKLDVKGFSRASNKFVDITDGDLPWPQVRQALDDIGYAGWATAEVDGGDVQRLRTVREQMQHVFGL